MRGFMSTWPFRGVALALCAGALLAGCAIAPRGSDERVQTAANELDQADVDRLEGATEASQDEGEDSSGLDADEAAADGSGDVNEPEPLPWRDYVLLADQASRQQPSCLMRYEPPEPEPLPWQPSHGTDGGGTSDSDKAR
jgi:hypothetical protein